MNDRRLKPCFTDDARPSTNFPCRIGIVKNHHGGIIQTAETLPKETCESPQLLTSVMRSDRDDHPLTSRRNVPFGYHLILSIIRGRNMQPGKRFDSESSRSNEQ